jgi:hypothetical protein
LKGIIFNVLEESVTTEFGADTWDDLLEAAKVDGAYASVGAYPDEQLYALVGAASAALKMPADDVLRWFGVRALPLLAKRYPGFFARHTTTRGFILTLDSIVHPEVNKLYPGSETPKFEFDTTSPDVLVMYYRSKRMLCPLVEGLARGAAEVYGETMEITHGDCMRRGAPHCRFELTFAKKPAAQT